MRFLQLLPLLLIFASASSSAYDSTWIRLSDGKFYTFNTPALIAYPDVNPVEFSDGTKFSEGTYLTDGVAGKSWPLDENWVAWKNKQVTITLDLGRNYAVSDIKIRAASRTEWTIEYPAWVDIETSLDGMSWSAPTRVNFPSDPSSGGYETYIAGMHKWVSARYVRYNFPYHNNHLFIDEMFVYGTSANKHPKMELADDTYYGAFPVTSGGSLSIGDFESKTQSYVEMVLWYRDLIPGSTSTYDHLSNTLLPAIDGRFLQLALVPKNVTAQTIASGAKDDAIRTWFQDVKNTNYPVWIRVMPEMNGCWAEPPTGTDSCGDGIPSLAYGGDPVAFKSAWRRMFNIAEKLGAADAEHTFVWAPATEGGESGDYYPGDQYVDWVGMSVYVDDCADGGNRCDAEFSNKIGPYYSEYGNRKPMMTAEGGCRHKNVSSERIEEITADCIEAWFNSVAAFDLEAIVYFNNFGSRLENSQTKLNAYKAQYPK